MRSPDKACWRTILIETPGEGAEPSRHERLAALYRFQNGQGAGDVRLVDPRCSDEVLDPAEIDWTHFPVVDALEAVTRDELFRLRSLLTTGALPPGSATSPTPPNGLVWGVDLRKAAPPMTPPEPTPSPPPSDA